MPFNGGAGKAPAVYFVDSAGEKTSMKIVSYSSESVTFETNHNSTYVVGVENSSESINFMLIAICALFIALLIIGIVVGNSSRKFKA